MRASKQHMEKIRGHILESSGQGFREEGYAGLGINALAKRAGMTSGAFYGHFSSKSQAFHEVIKQGMLDYQETLASFQRAKGAGWIHDFLDFYLSEKHVNDLAHSCVVPALSPDVMRADEATKEIYANELDKVAVLLSKGLQTTNKSNALALISLLAGTVMVARCASTKQQQQEILDAARQRANSLVAE